MPTIHSARRRRGATAGAVLAIVASSGCSSSSSPAPSSSVFSYKTPTVTVSPGQERYVCYAQTLAEDLQIDRFDYAVVPGVHHVFFSRTLAPEPNGLSECDVLFKTTWIPLFVAGTGSASMQDPPGAAAVLPKGTQINVQLHLLNPDQKELRVSATIEMHRSSASNPKPVGIYAFGTERITLAPSGPASVTDECTPT